MLSVAFWWTNDEPGILQYLHRGLSGATFGHATCTLRLPLDNDRQLEKFQRQYPDIKFQQNGSEIIAHFSFWPGVSTGWNIPFLRTYLSFYSLAISELSDAVSEKIHSESTRTTIHTDALYANDNLKKLLAAALKELTNLGSRTENNTLINENFDVFYSCLIDLIEAIRVVLSDFSNNADIANTPQDPIHQLKKIRDSIPNEHNDKLITELQNISKIAEDSAYFQGLSEEFLRELQQFITICAPEDQITFELPTEETGLELALDSTLILDTLQQYYAEAHSASPSRHYRLSSQNCSASVLEVIRSGLTPEQIDAIKSHTGRDPFAEKNWFGIKTPQTVKTLAMELQHSIYTAPKGLVSAGECVSEPIHEPSRQGPK